MSGPARPVLSGPSHLPKLGTNGPRIKELDTRGSVDTPVERRLVLKIRPGTTRTHMLDFVTARVWRCRALTGAYVPPHRTRDEGKAHIPAERPAPKEGARVSGSNVDEERPDRAQAAAGQGA